MLLLYLSSFIKLQRICLFAIAQFSSPEQILDSKTVAHTKNLQIPQEQKQLHIVNSRFLTSLSGILALLVPVVSSAL